MPKPVGAVVEDVGAWVEMHGVLRAVGQGEVRPPIVVQVAADGVHGAGARPRRSAVRADTRRGRPRRGKRRGARERVP